MSLPLDEPLHAKMQRQPYPPGFAALFATSPLAKHIGLAVSIGMALLFSLWAFQTGLRDGDGLIQWQGDLALWFQATQWQTHSALATPDLTIAHPSLDYLQRSSPLGFQLLFQGLMILVQNCSIPFSLCYGGLIIVLAIVIAIYSFQFTLLVFPIPLAGTIAAFFALQSLWSPTDPLVPSPQTLGYTAFLACFYYLQERSQPLVLRLADGLPSTTIKHFIPIQIRWGFLISLILVGLFNPRYLLILAGIFILHIIERLAIVPVGRKPQTVQEFLDWSKRQQARKGNTLKAKTKEKIEWKIEQKSTRVSDFYLPALGIILGLGLLAYGLDYGLGDSLSREQMMKLPEFYRNGLFHYFQPSAWRFWLIEQRSGFIPAISPPLLWSGLALIFWLRPWGIRQLPLLRHVRSLSKLLAELLFVALVCFILAHTFFLELGWPQNYVWTIDRLSLTIAASIFLTAILESIAQSVADRTQRFWGLLLSFIFIAIVWTVPLIHRSPPTPPLQSIVPSAFTTYLTAQPHPGLLATLLEFKLEFQTQTTALTTAQTPVAGTSTALLNGLQSQVPFYLSPHTLRPYHQTYYFNQRQQLLDLLRLQYLGSQSEFIKFIQGRKAQGYPIDFWLLDRDFFSLENWETYPELKQINPELDRDIRQAMDQKNIPF